MALTPDTSVQYLKGVGERRAALYQKLNIRTVEDLLYHFPRSYLDLTTPYPIDQAPLNQAAAVRGMVVKKSREQHIRKGLSVFKVLISDDTGLMNLTFFNAKFTVEALQLEEEYLFYGKVGGNFLKKEMSAPMVIRLEEGGRLIPVYPLTAGLSSRMIGANVAQALAQLGEHFPDPIPGEIRRRHGLSAIGYAMENIHRPPDPFCAEVAKRRLIFEELFFLSLALGSSREDKIRYAVPKMKPISLEPFHESLPFTPTEAQKRAIGDAIQDMCSGTPMNRLVQGDVGSGKTLVGAAAAYFAVLNGGQAAMMAPTEILAEQHFRTLNAILSPLGLNIQLLTGSMTAKAKRLVKAGLQDGSIHLCVGTHALLSDGVEFCNLALVITDEQHRFGVAQRIALSEKGQHAHTLVMSATPIPRTLALMIYGDLDLSVIDQLPAGRKPIKTYKIDSEKRQRAFGFIRSHLDQGYQAYIVCPLIETGEVDLGLKPAAEYAKELADGPFSGYRVGLLHGKMKAADKEKTMRAFQSGEIQLLVSTTVVEVGVDVPNAVIMMIENAERFGLSQLHQLRGRVGRGPVQSHCILLSDAKNPETVERLRVLCSTGDGFRIAEEDLRLRGPGDFFGYRQHGLPELKIADMASDVSLLKTAQEEAKAILAADPKLTLPQHQAMKERVTRILLSAGERPN